MLNTDSATKNAITILDKLLPLLSFIVPIVILYSLYPSSFEATWTGTWKNRMYYLFFVWLLALETILNWDRIRAYKHRIRSMRTIVFAMALFLPTIYVIVANRFALNQIIVDFAKQQNIKSGWAELMPLSTEYLVFAALFALVVISKYGKSGLKDYSISTFFLIIIGGIYTIDNIYPFGEFTPFQIMVSPTAKLAAYVLNLMGYQTVLGPTVQGMPYLIARNSTGSFGALIAWPCSGVESLLIYTVTIMLFLKRSTISLRAKIAYFVIGAAVTYLINILRIVTLFVIAVGKGDWGLFHDYYGSLYSIVWIICYPMIIIGSQTLWQRIGNRHASSVRPSDHEELKIG